MKRIAMVAAAALLSSPPALAQSKKGSPSAASRAAVIRSLPKGAAFTSKGAQYRFVGGARAVVRDAAESEAQALSRAGAKIADVIERKGGYLVFRAAKVPATPLAPEGSAGRLPVAVNVKTGHLGIVSGMINVRLQEGADPEAVARAHGIVLVSAAPRIRAAFFKAGAGQDLSTAAADLARDPAVESAEIEVIEHLATPQ